MTDTPTPEDEEAPLSSLQEALIAFTGAIGQAVPDICSYGLTIGEGYVPFNPDDDEDCDAEDVMCSQLWVRVTNVTPTKINEGFDGQACDTTLSIGLEIGVLRCFEIGEDGEAPTASQVLAASMQSMADMDAIKCAALDAKITQTVDGEQVEYDIWDIDLGSWAPLGPLGGQFGGVWTMTADL